MFPLSSDILKYFGKMKPGDSTDMKIYIDHKKQFDEAKDKIMKKCCLVDPKNEPSEPSTKKPIIEIIFF